MSFNNQYRPSGFGGLPPVTKNIIIINVILFVFTFVFQQMNINLTDYLGLHHHLAPAFKPHQFVTYIFMHASFQHLLFNMIGVYMFGQVLEQQWGPKRYLVFYIVTGLGAAVAQYLIMNYEISGWLEMANQQINEATDPTDRASLINQKYVQINSLDHHVIVGASGSLFGLLGAFGMLFPNQMLYIYFLFPVKAKWMVIAYGALELFSGLSNDPTDNVAHFAHLGGLFVGVILVLLWKKNKTHSY
ncbi:MAG: rhomboid family intramembrane serine protease [Bacteroidetes bacterium]|nr:rhomboid family intramembrane serine protease [Bacteroidota bacterium]